MDERKTSKTKDTVKIRKPREIMDTKAQAAKEINFLIAKSCLALILGQAATCGDLIAVSRARNTS